MTGFLTGTGLTRVALPFMNVSGLTQAGASGQMFTRPGKRSPGGPAESDPSLSPHLTSPHFTSPHTPMRARTTHARTHEYTRLSAKHGRVKVPVRACAGATGPQQGRPQARLGPKRVARHCLALQSAGAPMRSQTPTPYACAPRLSANEAARSGLTRACV
mgnify:CR=1 FL=1